MLWQFYSRRRKTGNPGMKVKFYLPDGITAETIGTTEKGWKYITKQMKKGKGSIVLGNNYDRIISVPHVLLVEITEE